MIGRTRDPAARIRGYLLATLAVGMIGMASELLLIGHRETAQQQIPLVLLGLGMATAVWHAAAPRAATVRALQVVMLLFVVSGVAGVVLHYRGNVEFELEMYPAMNGFELVQKTLTGATPVLAPGSMTLLGLIGLTHTYKHPCVGRGAGALRIEEGDA
jgi:hypothetical protein